MPTTNTPSPLVRVLIADDHTLIVSSVKDLISQRTDIKSIDTVGDGVSAIALVKEIQPDLLILDLALPFASGIEILAEVKRWSNGTRTLVLTGMTSPSMLQSAQDAGAHGIALKSTSLEHLAKGIDLVLKGESWICDEVLAILETHENPGSLTTREAQILNMIAQGMTNAEVGTRLGISPKTVDNHRTRIMAKLGVSSRAQLLAVALKSGLLDTYLQL